jgi:prepilin-type N-terminal cleavage/methylation domain-containing protein
MVDNTRHYKKGFTLIELITVISIIGLISTVVLANLTRARAKARDAIRVQALQELQKAVELYYQDYGAYPTTGNQWHGGLAGCFGGFGYGTAGYIPGIIPKYIGALPEDPKASVTPLRCFIYKSNGKDYMIAAYRGIETYNPNGTPLDRVADIILPTIAVYSSGAANW